MTNTCILKDTSHGHVHIDPHFDHRNSQTDARYEAQQQIRLLHLPPQTQYSMSKSRFCPAARSTSKQGSYLLQYTEVESSLLMNNRLELPEPIINTKC